MHSTEQQPAFEDTTVTEGEIEKLVPTAVVTAHGSEYRYLEDGRTQRYKAATGELYEPQDILVFIPPWESIKTQAPKLYPKIFGGMQNEREYDQLLLYLLPHPQGYICF